jgi:hypothetical protein
VGKIADRCPSSGTASAGDLAHAVCTSLVRPAWAKLPSEDAPGGSGISRQFCPPYD